MRNVLPRAGDRVHHYLDPTRVSHQYCPFFSRSTPQGVTQLNYTFAPEQLHKQKDTRCAARDIIQRIKATGRRVLNSLHLSSSSTVAAEPLLQKKNVPTTTITIRATAFEQRYITIKLLGSGGNGESTFAVMSG